MTPGTYNFPNQYNGDTYDGVEITLYNETAAAPIDLTGASLKIQFKTRRNSDSYVKQLEKGSGITVTNASGGIFEIDAFDVDMDPGKYFYDIQVTFSDGNVKTYVKGYMIVQQGTTE